MIAALALELLLIGLAVWQLVVLRRSPRADREREKDDAGEP
ncbi:hypothetical protein [Methylobacterium sp. Leaf456]|nr:hypothetical protein [Methylobacterium sp. Leaf456]